MSDGEGDDSAPLSDLLDEIGDGGADDDVWERLAAEFDVGNTPPPDDEELWNRLSAVEPEDDAPVERDPITDRTPAWATISNNAKIVHGYLTVLSFGAALVIYAGAVLGLLPRVLWLLSLPLFAVGVVLLIPILAWYLGVWDPTRIA